MKSLMGALCMLGLMFAGNSYSEIVVHEWGTFTSLVGSDGITQHGMYHEDEALPEFVHDFGETRAFDPRLLCRQGKGCLPMPFLTKNIITQKMETPVIYFYTDKRQSLLVDVNFPQGVVTETFPAPVETFPTKLSAPILANGKTRFAIEVLPSTSGDFPLVEAGNIYSHAREVASSTIVSGAEQEKFIFYRGLGRFQPKLVISSSDGNLSLQLAEPGDKPQAAFLVHVDQRGEGQMLDLEPFWGQGISSSLIAQLSDHSGLGTNQIIMSRTSARAKLIDSLTQAGLFLDEAVAMINTWENGYLKAPGLRLLYILPTKELDENLALSITPVPDSVKRVFVARVEILLDSEEQRILNEVLTQKADFAWEILGRFAEPMLRRVSQTYRGDDEQVKEAFQTLIQRSALIF